MFHKKTDEVFSSMLNVFGIADDILIVGFDKYARDHDDVLEKVLQIYRQLNLKLNKDKSLFRYTSILFGKVMSQQGVSPDQSKIQALADMLPPKIKKEL